MHAAPRRLPSPEAVRWDAISSYEMRLEAMRLAADRDYMKAKHSFDNALDTLVDTLRFTALCRPALHVSFAHYQSHLTSGSARVSAAAAGARSSHRSSLTSTTLRVDACSTSRTKSCGNRICLAVL